MRELERAKAPRAASGLAVTPSGEILVSGELSGVIARYAVRDGRLVRRGATVLPGVRSVRAIAAGDGGIVYVVEDHGHRLLTVDRHGALIAGSEGPVGLGPRLVHRTAHWVVVDCLLAHTIVARRLDARGIPQRDGEVRITHDGPFWALDAREIDDGLLLALGGVEDHPLDRRQGSFGYIDSFAGSIASVGRPPWRSAWRP